MGTLWGCSTRVGWISLSYDFGVQGLSLLGHGPTAAGAWEGSEVSGTRVAREG